MENKTCTKNICNFCIHFLTLVLITSILYSFGTYSIIYSPVSQTKSSLKTTTCSNFGVLKNKPPHLNQHGKEDFSKELIELLTFAFQ